MRLVPYFLADCMCWHWQIFVLPITDPTIEHSAFNQIQESIRKDIERALGVRFFRFKVLNTPICYWDRDDVFAISEVCVILNIIIIATDEALPYNEDRTVAEKDVNNEMEDAFQASFISCVQQEVHMKSVHFFLDVCTYLQVNIYNLL